MELIDKVRSRGFWRIVIRPAEFQKERIEYVLDLFEIVMKNAVTVGGWDFPHVEYTQPIIGDDWIQQETDWENFVEFWRMYQSGQFLFISGINYDWSDQSSYLNAPNWREKPILGIANALLIISQAFEFAARLALSKVGGETMEIHISLNGLKGRVLLIEAPIVPIVRELKALTEKWEYSDSIPTEKLVAETREIARKAAMKLFQKFGWKTSFDTLRALQDEVLRS